MRPFILVFVFLLALCPSILRAEEASEVVQPIVEGNLIKVNNQVCPVSKARFDEEFKGRITERVKYKGKNAEYHGKEFEFNFCCVMCKKKFPKMFKKDPDTYLKFYGLEASS
jgi:hypothetical protein